MNEILLGVVRLAMLVFLLGSMLDFGLGLGVREVLSPLRNARLVILSLVANFLIVPLLAVGIAQVVRLEPPFATGLLLLGLAPGAPFIPKIVQLARGNLAFAVGLMVLLMVGTVVFLPVVLPMLIAGVEVDSSQIARNLFVLMLLPLFGGLVIRARVHSLPIWLRPTLRVLSNVGGLVVLVLIVALEFGSVLSVFGTGAILASVVFVVLSALVGWLVGGAGRGTRDALALATGSRNVAAALLVGAKNFPDPRVNVMVIVSALVALSIFLPVARVLGGRADHSG
jgi:BASS family bile acid:Na+ symporter